jgi:hypothetical protein
MSDVIHAACAVFVTVVFGVLALTIVKHLNAEEYAEAPACVVTGDGRQQKKER